MNHHNLKPAPLAESRTERVLKSIDRSMRVLEIGPAFGPFAPKRDGWNSFSLDHATRDEIAAKYKAHGLAVDTVEEVDFVWTKGPIESAVPEDQHGTFDACIASHVIEHTPDFIAFLQSCAKLLKPGGVLSLVIPDKRYMYDVLQPLTLSDRIIQAHMQKRVRHTKETCLSNIYNAANKSSTALISWTPQSRDYELALTSLSVHEAYKQAQSLGEGPEAPYVDFHSWRFTPSSFLLIAVELSELGLFPFTINSFALNDPDTCEFYVSMRNEYPSQYDERFDEVRFKLLRDTAKELKYQLDQYLKPGFSWRFWR